MCCILRGRHDILAILERQHCRSVLPHLAAILICGLSTKRRPTTLRERVGPGELYTKRCAKSWQLWLLQSNGMLNPALIMMFKVAFTRLYEHADLPRQVLRQAALHVYRLELQQLPLLRLRPCRYRTGVMHEPQVHQPHECSFHRMDNSKDAVTCKVYWPAPVPQLLVDSGLGDRTTEEC